MKTNAVLERKVSYLWLGFPLRKSLRVLTNQIEGISPKHKNVRHHYYFMSLFHKQTSDDIRPFTHFTLQSLYSHSNRPAEHTQTFEINPRRQTNTIYRRKLSSVTFPRFVISLLQDTARVTYVSGNSTGLLLILLWSASMYSSINGHWRT